MGTPSTHPGWPLPSPLGPPTPCGPHGTNRQRTDRGTQARGRWQPRLRSREWKPAMGEGESRVGKNKQSWRKRNYYCKVWVSRGVGAVKKLATRTHDSRPTSKGALGGALVARAGQTRLQRNRPCVGVVAILWAGSARIQGRRAHDCVVRAVRTRVVQATDAVVPTRAGGASGGRAARGTQHTIPTLPRAGSRGQALAGAIESAQAHKATGHWVLHLELRTERTGDV